MKSHMIVFWDQWKYENEDIAFSLMINDDKLNNEEYLNKMYDYINEMLSKFEDKDGSLIFNHNNYQI
uniref:Uncharacterized protein n=1 Tax=Pithovirus LCPAC401 TaxID=2506595 RepID=A0A481Z9S7_9VIRU|nr:MAG: hypothetical protein LCPAC401_02050 [Pithovirus LCPAC401]